MNPSDIANTIPDESSALSGAIVIHRHGDGTYVDAKTEPGLSINGGYAEINLPNGDTIYIANSLNDLLSNIQPDESELEALFNAGIIGTDDDGHYMI